MITGVKGTTIDKVRSHTGQRPLMNPQYSFPLRDCREGPRYAQTEASEPESAGAACLGLSLIASSIMQAQCFERDLP